MHSILLFIVNTISALGYPGIFILMAMESSIIPLPSEVVMPPAGYLASKGEMNIIIVIILGTLGSLFGAYLNYFGAMYLGRPFLIRYGRYVFISERKLKRVEDFFQRHGEISTFLGRLLPVARHLISIPAGLARMNHLKFTLYTLLGAFIWVSILTLLGYFIGENQELLRRYLREITIGLVVAGVVIVAIYIYLHSSRKVESPSPAKDKREVIVHDCEESDSLKLFDKVMRDYLQWVEDVIFIVNKDMRILYITPNVKKILGYSDTELMGKDFREAGIIHRDDLMRAVKDVMRVLSGEPESNNEYRFITSQGDVRIVSISGGPLIQNGEITGFTGIARDVTEQRRVDRFFKGIIDSIGEGILLIDRDYRIVFANESILRSYGFEEKDVRGMHCYEISHHLDVSCDHMGEECPVREVFQSGGVKRVVHKHIDSENRELFLEITAYPLRDEKGEITGVVELLHDITDKYLLEEENKKRMRELETFFELAVQRELRMKELKEENRRLKEEISRLKR